MPLESRIEQKACEMITLACPEAVCLKLGWEGWPDRIILLGSNLCTFIEFKQAGAVLRADQKVRVKNLVENGYTVLVIDDLADLPPLISDLRDAKMNLNLIAAFSRFAKNHAPTQRALRASGASC